MTFTVTWADTPGGRLPSRTESLDFEVSDVTGLTIVASLADGQVEESVFRGEGFSYLYSGSTFTPGAGLAGTFSISRRGGWPVGANFSLNIYPGGGGVLSITSAKTANYTATAGELVPVDLATAGGNVTITLPTGEADDQVGVLIKGVAGAYSVTVAAAGGQTIIGSPTLTLAHDNACVNLHCDGSVWRIVSTTAIDPADGSIQQVSTGVRAHLLRATSTKTTNYSASDLDLVVVDLATAATDLTITAPSPTTDARFGVVLSGSAYSFRATISPNGAETFQGASSYTLEGDGAWVVLQYDGARWVRLGGSTPDWTTILSVDFSAQSNAALANGANTIAGKTFTAANLGAAVSASLVNGTGLRFVTDGSTAHVWGSTAPTCALITLATSQMADWDATKEHIFQWYLSTTWLNSANAFQCAYGQIDSAANLVASQLAVQRLGGGNNWGVYSQTNSSNSGQTPGDVITIHRKADQIAQMGWLTWGGAGSRFKTPKDIVVAGTVQQASTVIAPRFNRGLAFGAWRGAGAAFTLDVVAMRVLQSR